MGIQAQMVIRAAKNRNNWGDYAASRFVEKGGIPNRLYEVAKRCEATIGKPFERRTTVYGTLNGLI